MQKTTRIAFLAAAALALPAAAAAQQTTPAPAPAPVQASAQDEITRIQQRLGALQQQAAQDSAVRAQEQAFDAYVAEAMNRLDPAAAGKRARAESIKTDVEAARAANDNAKLNALAAEATELQAYFAQMRPRTLALPDVQQKRQAYVQALFTKMNQIDPEAQALVARLQQLRSGGATAPAPATP
ncbi:MAG TPA: hypothetical protein VF263_24885 [Longimicrobiaceae bacterium]